MLHDGNTNALFHIKKASLEAEKSLICGREVPLSKPGRASFRPQTSHFQARNKPHSKRLFFVSYTYSFLQKHHIYFVYLINSRETSVY